MIWTKARRVLPWLTGVAALLVLVTPAWILYAPAVADWRWERTVERAQELSFCGQRSSTPLRTPPSGQIFWAATFGTVWLEQVWTGPFFFHHELTLTFAPTSPVARDGILEAAVAEARRVFPELRLDVHRAGERWNRR